MWLRTAGVCQSFLVEDERHLLDEDDDDVNEKRVDLVSWAAVVDVGRGGVG